MPIFGWVPANMAEGVVLAGGIAVVLALGLIFATKGQAIYWLFPRDDD